MRVFWRVCALVLATGLPLTLGACGDTLQSQPMSARSLESLVLVETNPVYWLGGRFRGLRLSEVDHDPGGASTLQYGNCTEGGQSSCVYPLTIVSSPDNSFRPGGEAQRQGISLRGVKAFAFQEGRAITLATGEVVVSLYAQDGALARAAAEKMIPINRVGAPYAKLPAALADTGFAKRPLAAQRPPVIEIPGRRAH